MKFRLIQRADGAPVPGAEVWVVRPADSQEEQLTTDEAGECTIGIEEPLPDFLCVHVRRPGFVPQSMAWDLVETPSLPGSFTMALDPSVRIGGRVVDEGGDAVDGVEVRLIISETAKPEKGGPRTDLFDKMVTTDAEGRWQFEEAPPNFSQIFFRLVHPDHVEALHFTPAEIPAERFLREDVVWRMQRGVRVEGTVVDAAGRPVPNAEILPGKDRVCSNCKPSFRTDPEGCFSVPHTPGESASLTVKAEGHGPALVQFKVQHGMPRMSIALPPAQRLRGRVVDAVGLPLPKVHVFADTWRGHRTLEWRILTDNEGRFEWLNAPVDEVQFDFLKRGYRSARKTSLTASEAEQTILLRRPMRIRGKVRDAETGEPVASFQVIPGMSRPDNHVIWLRAYTITCSGGTYERSAGDDLPSNAPLHLRVESDGYLSAQRSIPDFGEEATLDFELSPGDPLRGRLVSADGDPIADATVVIVTGDHASLHGAKLRAGSGNVAVTTSLDGTFRFASQEPPYALVVAHALGYGFVTAGELAKNGLIRLRPWGRVEIAADDSPPGKEKIPFYIHYHGDSGEERKFIFIQPIGERTGDGRIVFEHLPPGKALLGRFNFSNHDALTLEIESGRTLSLDFTRGSKADGSRIPGTVAIKVIDESGVPVEGATVVVKGYGLGGGTSGFNRSISTVEELGLRTNQQGVVTLSYPQKFRRQDDVESIQFCVRHPDFCTTNARCPVEGEALPIVLKRGGDVRVTGWTESGCAANRVYAQLVAENRRESVHASEWTVENDCVLVHHHLPPGKFLLRLVGLPDVGAATFSDVVEVNLASGESLEFRLPLKRAMAFHGQLDATVPRPVSNGLVVVNVCTSIENCSLPMQWRAEAVVMADGSFELESLPSGEVELIASCDGFVSTNPPADERSRHARLPQRFPTGLGVIAMEIAAAARVRVLDRSGQPIVGAQIVFQPNVQWGDRSSGHFDSGGFSTANMLRSPPGDWRKRLAEPGRRARFHGVTDERGTVTIVNLPAGEQRYHVHAPGFEVEQSGDFGFPGLLKASLISGRIQDLRVVMDRASQ